MQFSRVWLHFIPTTLCREGEKTIWILKLCFLLTAGIKPGPPDSKRARFPLHHCPSKGVHDVSYDILIELLRSNWNDCGSTLSLFRAHKSSRKLSHIFLQRCRRFDFIFKKRKSIFFGIVLEFSFFLFFCWIGFGRKFPFFVKRKPKQENHSSLGNGSGSVGRVVFSDAREPRFKSQHRQNFIYKLYKLIK